MRIGIDLDGVVYPWHESLHRYFTELKGYEGSITDFWLKFVPTKDASFWDYYVSLPFLYWDTTPRQDVFDYLPKIAELGEIFYITARPEEAKPKTRKFFDFYDLPFKENVIFTKDKPAYVRLLGLDYFVDDLPRNVDDVSSLTKAYLFRCVHNRPVQDNYNTVGSLHEFYHTIKIAGNMEALGF